MLPREPLDAGVDRNRHHGRTHQYRRRPNNLKGDFNSHVSLVLIDSLGHNSSIDDMLTLLWKSIKHTTNLFWRGQDRLRPEVRGCRRVGRVPEGLVVPVAGPRGRGGGGWSKEGYTTPLITYTKWM